MRNKGTTILLLFTVIVLALCGGTARMRPQRELPPAPSAAPAAAAAPAASAAPKAPAAAQPSPAAETPVPTPVPTEPPAPEYFTLSFVGDCTLASVPGYQGGPYGYDTVVGDDYAYPFALTADYFADDDFTMANLECCLTESTAAVAKTFTFKTHAPYAKVLSEGGVEFVTLANNHILDYGEQGVADTKAALDAEQIAYAGRDEYTVYETVSGLKIGVYAVSFGTVDQIKTGIANVKAEGAEFVIAALHWGDEGSYHTTRDQVAQAHAAVEAGADFVYGSHPHTLQPREEYQGIWIYYSMGNWTFGGNTNPRDKDTFILRLTVERAPDGAVSVTDREEIPCACSGVVNGNNYQPVPYAPESEEYARTLSKLDGSFSGGNLSIGYSYSANE